MANGNRDKGVKFEREICAYLRAWWPEVDRTVAAGYTTSGGTYVAKRRKPDKGDIAGFGTAALPVVIQAKDVTGTHPKGLANKALDDLLTETRRQRYAAGAVLGLLVEKRSGYVSAGDAWVHLDARELTAILDGWSVTLQDARDQALGPEDTGLDEHGGMTEYLAPIRMRFGDLVGLMLRCGFAPDPSGPGQER